MPQGRPVSILDDYLRLLLAAERDELPRPMVYWTLLQSGATERDVTAVIEEALSLGLTTRDNAAATRTSLTEAGRDRAAGS
jgi:hypothetical protein